MVQRLCLKKPNSISEAGSAFVFSWNVQWEELTLVCPLGRAILSTWIEMRAHSNGTTKAGSPLYPFQLKTQADPVFEMLWLFIL
jgi:hypothetical protein